MYIDLSEEEAHVLILKGLGLDEDAKLKKRGDFHALVSSHKIVIKLPGEAGSIFRPLDVEVEILPAKHDTRCGPNCSCKPESEKKEIPDECFVVDGVDDDGIAQLEEDLDGT